MEINRRLAIRKLFKLVAVGSAQKAADTQAASASADLCQLPVDHILRTKIDTLPIDTRLGDMLRALPNRTIWPDFGSGLWAGQPLGIPINYVESLEGASLVTFEYSSESDHSRYPVPPNPKIEGGNKSNGDRHILMCLSKENRLYELFSAYPVSDQVWRAGGGAIFDLNSYKLRPNTFSSADAAGLPIAPLLVKYEEIAAGRINHALRFTAVKTARRYLWPARHFASNSSAPTLPPMGLRLRLKADWPIARFPPQAKIILAALKEYGMVLADNGSSYFISGTPNERWDNQDLATIKKIPITAFEAVDTDSMMESIDSSRIRKIK